MILLLGWLFLPVYIASGCATMPEYMRRRFGGNRLRILYSVQSLLMYILVQILVSLLNVLNPMILRAIMQWLLFIDISHTHLRFSGIWYLILNIKLKRVQLQ